MAQRNTESQGNGHQSRHSSFFHHLVLVPSVTTDPVPSAGPFIESNQVVKKTVLEFVFSLLNLSSQWLRNHSWLLLILNNCEVRWWTFMYSIKKNTYSMLAKIILDLIIGSLYPSVRSLNVLPVSFMYLVSCPTESRTMSSRVEY